MVRSIGWRLQIWHGMILLLVLTGFAAVLYFHVRQARVDQIDAELDAAGRIVELLLRPGPPPPRDGGGPRHSHEGGPGKPPKPRKGKSGRNPLEYDLTFPEGFLERFRGGPEAPYLVVWHSGTKSIQTFPSPSPITYEELPALPEVPIESPQFRWRGDNREVTRVGPGASQILVGRPVRAELRQLSQLVWLCVSTGLGALGVGLLGGWLVSRRVMRPIAAIGATAAAISASNLSQRIDLKVVDRELDELARALNTMFDRLETAFEQQVRFTADASHELRTPLAVIHSQAELALTRPRSAEEYRESLAKCLKAAQRMRGLVEGLLTLARADAGALELRAEVIDLTALVEESAALVGPLAEEREVSLTLAVAAVTVCGDAARLTQVLINLLNNAIHYNRPAGQVIVTLATSGAEALLAVRDTGCGISAEHGEHVFERFYRADKIRSRERGGSGLGLAICKSIVEAHGGTIDYTSIPKQGTTFTVRLPLHSQDSG